MINGQVMTLKSNAVYKGKQTLLKDIVLTKGIDNSYYLTSNELKGLEVSKGAKNPKERIRKVLFIRTRKDR